MTGDLALVVLHRRSVLSLQDHLAIADLDALDVQVLACLLAVLVGHRLDSSGEGVRVSGDVELLLRCFAVLAGDGSGDLSALAAVSGVADEQLLVALERGGGDAASVIPGAEVLVEDGLSSHLLTVLRSPDGQVPDGDRNVHTGGGVLDGERPLSDAVLVSLAVLHVECFRGVHVPVDVSVSRRRLGSEVVDVSDVRLVDVLDAVVRGDVVCEHCSRVHLEVLHAGDVFSLRSGWSALIDGGLVHEHADEAGLHDLASSSVERAGRAVKLGEIGPGLGSRVLRSVSVVRVLDEAIDVSVLEERDGDGRDVARLAKINLQPVCVSDARLVGSVSSPISQIMLVHLSSGSSEAAIF